MFNLAATDVLEAIAGTTNKIKFTVSGHDATDGLVSKEGYVTNANTELYTAVGATRIYSVTFHNTDTSAVTITLNKDPTDTGTLWSFFSISLGVGYDLKFDGVDLTVRDASGRILKGYAAHADDHKAGGADDLLSDPGAIGDTPGSGAFTTLDASGLITADAGVAFPSDTMSDYKEGYHEATIVSGGGGYLMAVSNTLAYTRSGRLVHIQGSLAITSEDGTPNGAITVSLPFACAELTDSAEQNCGSVDLYGFGTGPTIPNGVSAEFSTGSAFIYLSSTPDNGQRINITYAEVDTAWTLRLSFTYVAV